ncbi:olfactomedin-like isoform X1 [Anolis carolinensis]|uniref:olfactomedin-like isoform X1 n=1 Tax=Anolis carolinensis TaxID=28377 RepID=UPI002F2B8D40
MNTILPYLLLVASLVIVDGSHIAKVVGVRDASGQCICTMHLANVVFPAPRVEQLESDFYNLTNQLQEQLNEIYNGRNNMSIITTNLTDLAARIKYAKTYGTHIDLNFDKVINDLQSVIAVAQDISKNATTDSTKKLVDSLIEQINNINTAVTTMEGHDKNNIVTIQREINNLRKKLQECEEAIASGAGLANLSMSPPVGDCNHGGILKVSDPVLVKLNWKGSDFKAGSWGKDFAVGTKTPDHYWVFPLNKDERTLESYRLYSSYKKLLIYSPVREYSLNIRNNPNCEDCGQGAGVIFFNGSFYYNCFDSRALCRADPFSMRISRENIEDQDPASFNNWFSYKGVKYQDIDLAGDEKGLWMVHGSTLSNGKLVIKKVDPETLKVGIPWITSQSKDALSNSFMICGVLYATKRKNSTHDEINYMYDTNTGQESNIKIFIEKPLPTVQSLNYNPNDRKLYMYNDGYLVSYNITFINSKSKVLKDVAANEQDQASGAEGEHSLVKSGSQSTTSQDNPSSDSISNQQQYQEKTPVSVTVEKRETMREGSHIVASQ